MTNQIKWKELVPMISKSIELGNIDESIKTIKKMAIDADRYRDERNKYGKIILSRNELGQIKEVA